MVAVSDFSGLASLDLGLGQRAAIAPIVSLQRCMTGLHVKEVKTDGAGFGALGAHAMADGFLGVLRHQLLELGLGRLMLQDRPLGSGGNTPANSAQELDELMSTTRTASIRGRGGSTPKR